MNARSRLACLAAGLFVAAAACTPDTATLPASDTETGTQTGSTGSSSGDDSSTTVITTTLWGSTVEPETSTGSGSTADTATTDEPQPLDPDPGESRYALVGETVALDGSRSIGASLYQWNFDNGTPPTEPSEDPLAEISYDTPGRYRPILTVFDDAGNSLSENVTITATLEPTHAPNHASSIAMTADDTAVVVSPDSGEIVTITRRGDEFALGQRIAACETPRTAVWSGGQVLVACQDERVAFVNLETEDVGPMIFHHGERPFGIIAVGDTAYVTLQGTGEVGRINLTAPALEQRYAVIEDARGIAEMPDGRLAVTRWRSADAEASIALLDPASGAVEEVSLQFDPQPASDTEAGGLPSYLFQVLVSPIGDVAAVPSLQANHRQGEFLNGEALTFETTLRGVVSYLELGETVGENFTLRKHFDNRGFMSAGVHSSRGDYLFLAARGARAVERVDTFTGAQAGGLLDVGFAPEGLALTADDRFLLVNAFMSRQVHVYDVSDFSVLPQPIATIDLVEDEPLAADVAFGKVLFNDAFDPRLSKDGYMACAHCHLDGESDRRTWDFTDRGEGLRNTISLRGREGDAHGPIHWSANFDEIHDFENDIRGPFGGAGLMSDAAFDGGTVSETLGDPKAGLSVELDALAAYVTSLDAFPRSPYRELDGALTPTALAGQVIFESVEAGCTMCHAGPRLTDSAFTGPGVPLLHDVGTLGLGSGQRLGGPLDGIDTPTLHGLWNGAPYLHDGSAATVRDVLTTANPGDGHGGTSQLSDVELGQLELFLLSLEG